MNREQIEWPVDLAKNLGRAPTESPFYSLCFYAKASGMGSFAEPSAGERRDLLKQAGKFRSGEEPAAQG